MARPKSEDKRNAILDAATRLFAERGLTAAPTPSRRSFVLAVASLLTNSPLFSIFSKFFKKEQNSCAFLSISYSTFFLSFSLFKK